MPEALNKAVSGNFRTKPCRGFIRGHCSYGDKCRFAHGIDDVRKHLPDGQGLVAKVDPLAGTLTGEHTMFDEIPEKFLQNRGRFGENSAVSIGTTGSSRDNKCGSGQLESKRFINPKPMIWKTELCNKWEMNGDCPYGAICYFAHGKAELQKLDNYISFESGIVPTNTFPTANDGLQTTYEKKVQGTKRAFKWKEFEKINGIYADWIDDVRLLHRPNRM